ncbi:MAG TPA: hypothetical protein VNW71_25740 [Thermoanaerobaculia bacterium]|nr:hypothetical protein [Thermoanaerobaculia bacterium]
MNNVKRLEEAGAVVAANLTPQERERLEALSEKEVGDLIGKSQRKDHHHVEKKSGNNGEQKRSYEE